jgi:hypothetical protein
MVAPLSLYKSGPAPVTTTGDAMAGGLGKGMADRSIPYRISARMGEEAVHRLVDSLEAFQAAADSVEVPEPDLERE